jgi:RimJ/RimL family protein N-acetyltransferase
MTMYAIETERLLLRLPEDDDAAIITTHLQDPEIARTTLTIPYPYHHHDALRWISLNRNKLVDKSGVTFVILLKETPQLIGAIGLELHELHRRGEAGYWIAHPFWNKGYCTEALKGLVKFGFEELHLHKIYATHMPENVSSGKVMQKTGMKQEGILKDHYYKDGRFITVTQYAIITGEEEPL